MKEKSLESLNNYLFSENERLNAIIDDLEEKINKAIDYINENKVDLSWFMTTDKYLKIEGISNVVSTFRLLEILGGDNKWKK